MAKQKRPQRKVMQLYIPERLKSEMILASFIDDDKTLNAFVVDAIRVRVDHFLDKYRDQIPVGHPLFRPEGAPAPAGKEDAIQKALARLEQANETLPLPPSNPTPHPLGRHLPGKPKYAPHPKP